MSRVGRVLFLSLTASGAHAQGPTLDRLGAAAGGLDSAQSLRRPEGRSDSLAFEWRRANALAAMVDSVDRAPGAAGSGTVRVGALRIITDRSAVPLRGAGVRGRAALH